MATFMQRNLSRLRAIGTVLAEGRHLGLALMVAGAALAWVIRFPTEPSIRLSGLVLQLLGIGTVLWGIKETRALFGRPPLSAKARSWFARLAFLHKGAPVPGDSLSVSVSLIGGRMHSVHTPPENATVEQRVVTLELNITATSDRIANVERELDSATRSAEDQLRSEQRTREGDITAVRDKLETSGTGGLHISAIGALWLFVGVVLSTASLELSSLLR